MFGLQGLPDGARVHLEKGIRVVFVGDGLAALSNFLVNRLQFLLEYGCFLNWELTPVFRQFDGGHFVALGRQLVHLDFPKPKGVLRWVYFNLGLGCRNGGESGGLGRLVFLEKAADTLDVFCKRLFGLAELDGQKFLEIVGFRHQPF